MAYPSAIKGGEEEAEKSGGGGEGEEGGTGKRKFTGSPPAETEEEELHSGTKSLISVAFLLLLVQDCSQNKPIIIIKLENDFSNFY